MTSLYEHIENIAESESSNPFKSWNDESWKEKEKMPESPIDSPIKIPTALPPTAMPVPDEQAIKDAKKLATRRQLGRRGRRSTILTDSGDIGTLGG